jgi:hypothetical protein
MHFAEAAATLAEHRMIPDIAGRRLDTRASRRYWRRSIASPRKRLFVAADGTKLLGAIGIDLIVSRHRLAHVRRRVYLHSLFVVPAARRRLGWRWRRPTGPHAGYTSRWASVFEK